MTVPVAQAGADQVFSYSTLPKLASLFGSATNGPITAWEWYMLSVPEGSSANVGTNVDFVDGVSTVQNPQFTCDVAGCFVLQLRAQNSSGWSIPLVDREGGQTAVYILTQKLSLKIPGAFLYRYDGYLNETLESLETAFTGRGNSMIAMATNENTDSGSDVVVGANGLADTFLTGLTTAFAATAYVTAGGLTGTIELYNLTDAVSVATLTFTELVSTRKTSAPFSLAAGTKIYEVRIKVAGGSTSADRVACMWAGIEVTAP